MLIFWGSLDLETTYYNYKTLSIEWEECLDTCYEDEKCAVASYISRCSLAYQGDILKLSKGTEWDGLKVAMKVKAETDECSSKETMMAIRTVIPTDTSIFGIMSYVIKESDTDYTFDYNFQALDSSCKDWFEKVPQCESPCDTMMMPFYGEFNNPTLTLRSDATTLRECMILCYKSDTCSFVQFSNNECNEVTSQSSTIKASVYFMAMKMKFSTSKCPTSFDTAMADGFSNYLDNGVSFIIKKEVTETGIYSLNWPLDDDEGMMVEG